MSGVTAATLRDHVAYSAWATARLLAAVRELTPEELARDFGTADRTVPGTLAHTFAADRVWLARLNGASPAAFLGEDEDRADFLQREFPALHQRWREWGAGLTDESAGAEIDYRDLKGNAWRNTVWEIVLHVVNHATHHRGQVAGFLRSMGHTPPPLDLIAYYRQR